MPSKMFHSTISAEILRICRATAAEDDFYRSATPFLSRMHKQGALEGEIGKFMNKLLHAIWSQMVDPGVLTQPRSILNHSYMILIGLDGQE